MPFYLKIIICVALCVTLGFLSGFSTVESIEGWYATLNKPPFNPPNWIFGPVWTVLYIMMGVAAALIWEEGWENTAVKTALGIFIAQFVLNIVWTPIFFGMEQLLFALAIIVILWVLIFICIRKFRAIKPLAGNLLIPYILWVSFATLLNFSIWYLN